jgi:CDK inhibitor PHO81
MSLSATSVLLTELLDPVFFASQCGKSLETAPSCAAAGTPDLSDRRKFGLGAAVGFAKSNNLLGVLLESEILVCHLSGL